MNSRPNFFIVGAPKAGTTALHTYLDTHPQVCMSDEKEPNYFSHTELNEQQLYYNKPNIETEEEYLAQFNCSDTAIAIGEASVSYLFYPDVAQRIFAFNPDARIIISLREPVSRAFSHYQMDYSLGLLDVTFEDILKGGPTDPQLANYYQQYILLSEYFEQVKRYTDIFPEKNILIILQEDLIKHSEKTLHNVCTFLKIDPELRSTVFEKQNVTSAGKNKFIRILYSQPLLRKASQLLMSESIKQKIKDTLFSRNALPQLTPETSRLLKQYFEDDINKTENLIHRDLSSWKNILH
jgi:hypothetical protein